jgi:uncharacterized protein
MNREAADSSDPVAGLLERLRSALATESNVRPAVLFGSAATGRLRPISDLDVAILAQEEWPDSRDLSLQSSLTLAAGREVDLIRLDRASTLLKWQVAKSAVLLKEAHPGEFARFRAHAASEYADFAPTFERYGELFQRRLIERGTRR